jgi:hypothetical protein
MILSSRSNGIAVAGPRSSKPTGSGGSRDSGWDAPARVGSWSVPQSRSGISVGLAGIEPATSALSGGPEAFRLVPGNPVASWSRSDRTADRRRTGTERDARRPHCWDGVGMSGGVDGEVWCQWHAVARGALLFSVMQAESAYVSASFTREISRLTLRFT